MIKCFQLLNFQSWSKDSPIVSLESDITNIIEGPNETGKSVLFKALYNMVFPGYWSHTELIRRGYSTAALILCLDDNTMLAYTLEGSHYSVILQDGDNETTWRDYKILPAEIVTKLGLIIDYNSKVILNIVDKDVPLPFIKTTPVFNASLWKAIVEPPQITEFFEDINNQIALADKGKQYFFQSAEKAHAAADVIPYVNEDLLKVKISAITKLSEVAKLYDQMHESFETLVSLQQNKPQPVKNPDSYKPLVEYYDIISCCCGDIQTVIDCCEAKPLAVASPEKEAPKIKLYDFMQCCLKDLENFVSLVAKKPKRVVLPDVLEEIAYTEELNLLVESLNSCLNICNSLGTSRIQAETCANSLAELRQLYGVCPTCGRLLEETNA